MLAAVGDASEISLQSPRLRRLLAYWERQRGSRRMPSRRDLDPSEIPDLLPFLMLIDVIPEPPDFRYRLIGTEVVAISHADHTGRRFSELAGKGPESVVWQNCETVRRTGQPFSRLPPYVGPHDYIRCLENLLLPLGDDEQGVVMICQGIHYRRTPD